MIGCLCQARVLKRANLRGPYKIRINVFSYNIAMAMPKLYYSLCFAFSLVMAPALIVVFMNQDMFIKAFVQSLLGDEK